MTTSLDILARHGREDLALLYVGRNADGSLVEFVESLQPPLPREDKWVLIVSTLKGCPVRCRMCDAGGYYEGCLSAAEILAQIDVMITARFPHRRVPIPKFKVQFARMGEPALNGAVLEVLERLPSLYDAPGLMPCLSSVLPRRCEAFFARLRDLKDARYRSGRFQLQFSLHTTDAEKRRDLIPYPVLDFADAAGLGERFFRRGDRKIGLNFAAAQGYPVDSAILKAHFDPSIFTLKITPLNPTSNSGQNSLKTQIDPATGTGSEDIISDLRGAGYDVILSLGQPEEDAIGSNCGQYISRFRTMQVGFSESDCISILK